MEQEKQKSFFRNIFEKAAYVGDFVKNVVSSAARGLSREAGSLMLWTANRISGNREDLIPRDDLSKYLFGDEPLKEKSPLQVSKDAINFLGDITWRPFARAVGKTTLSAYEKFTGNKIEEPLTFEYGPLPRSVLEFIFGKEPIPTLGMERKEYVSKYGKILGNLGFLGFLALDLWVPMPGKGAAKAFLSKEVIKDIAKSSDKNFIKNTLLKELPELHHSKVINKVDDIAEKLVSVNKSSEVVKTLQREFDNIGKEMGVDLAKIRKEMMETDFKKTISEVVEKQGIKEVKPETGTIAKTAAEGGKIPPKPPKNPPLDYLSYKPEFNPKGGEFKLRGYFKNLWENKPEFKERVSDLLDELSVYYKPIKNKEIIDRAVNEMMRYETLDEAYKSVGFRLMKSLPRDPGRLTTEVVKNVLLSEMYWEAGMKTRATKIMDNIVGLYGEIGQALQSARFTPKLSSAYLSAWAPKKFSNILKEMAEKRGKVLSDEFLNDIGGKIRKIFTDIEVPAEKERALMELINKEIVPQLPLTFLEKINLFRYGNMLSGPLTHLRNLIGNTVQLINRNFFVLPTEAVIEYLKNPFNPALREIYFSDLPKIWKETLGSLGLAFETAVRVFQKGEVSERMFDFLKGSEDAFETMVNFSRYNNVPLTLKPASYISKTLESADKFFTTLIAQGEKFRLMQQAERSGQKITKSLLRQIEEQAQEVAAEYFFRRNLGVGTEKLNYFAQALDWVGESILNKRNEALRSKNPVAKAMGLGLSMLVPFIRTPVDIGIVMLEHSPLGFVRPIDSYTSEKLAQAVAGSIFSGVGAWCAFNDRTTWIAPKNEKEKAIFYENRKPFSININGADVPLLYFGPYGVALAVPAALKWALAERKPDISPGLDEALAATALETVRFIMSQTSLEGLTRLGKVLSGDEIWVIELFCSGIRLGR